MGVAACASTETCATSSAAGRASGCGRLELGANACPVSAGAAFDAAACPGTAGAAFDACPVTAGAAFDADACPVTAGAAFDAAFGGRDGCALSVAGTVGGAFKTDAGVFFTFTSGLLVGSFLVGECFSCF